MTPGDPIAGPTLGPILLRLAEVDPDAGTEVRDTLAMILRAADRMADVHRELFRVTNSACLASERAPGDERLGLVAATWVEIRECLAAAQIAAGLGDEVEAWLREITP